MPRIIFFSQFPFENNMQDGFYVRVKNIDNIFINENRIYLHISFRRHFKYEEYKISKNLIVINANIIFHYFKILKILNTSKIYYFQSLYNYLLAIFLPIKKNIKVIWDVHGVVPEELSFYKKKIKAYLFELIEYFLARRADIIVSVTKSMQDYYIEKYKNFSKINIIYPVINKLMFIAPDKEYVDKLRKELNITYNDTVFIYSGSLVKWQRFDDILKIIKELENDNYYFIILTGQIEEVEKKIKDCKLGLKKILIRTVRPNELSNYYCLAHYGFVLRDNHVLNKVAAPTKLLEYMYYGLTPIVDFEKIGDFFELGYEYINQQNASNNMLPHKSEKNIKIIKTMLNNNIEQQFLSLILNEEV